MKTAPARTPKAKNRTLTQQQADFTAEGAPAPVDSAPVTTATTTKAASPANAPVARKGPSLERRRWGRAR